MPLTTFILALRAAVVVKLVILGTTFAALNSHWFVISYNIFLEKGSYKDKSNANVTRWMFVYYKCYISIELTFLRELMLIKQ